MILNYRFQYIFCTPNLFILNCYFTNSLLYKVRLSVLRINLFSALTEIYIFNFGSVPDGRTTIEQ